MPFKEGYTKLTVLYKILRINKFLKNIKVNNKPYIELDFPNALNNFYKFLDEYYYESIYQQFVDTFSQQEMLSNLPAPYNIYNIGFDWIKGCKSLIPTTLDDYEEYYLPYIINVRGGFSETKKVLEKLYNYYSNDFNSDKRQKAFKKVKDFIKPEHQDHHFGSYL